MGRPKKSKEPMDWFTARVIQITSRVLKKIKEEKGEKAAQVLREMLFHEEFIHHYSKGPFRHWLIAYQWLIKLEWNSKHQVPEKKSIRDALKPQGLLLQKYFRMAEKCMIFAPELTQYTDGRPLVYRTGVNWIKAVVDELLLTAIMDASASKYNDLGLQGNIKNSLVSIERKRLALIKKTYKKLLDVGDKGSVEFNKLPYKEFDHMIAYKELLSYSMIFALASDRFRDDYWKPFLKQYSAWITEMSSPRWQVVMLESDNKEIWKEYQHDCGKSLVCIGNLPPKKTIDFIPHTQQGFHDFPQTFSGEIKAAYNPRKISFVAPKYF